MDDPCCAVCNGPACETCALCESTAYCCTDHQKTHWPEHKSTCRPYRVDRSDTLGRFLVAARDMKAGEAVLRERPTLLGPPEDAPPVCLGCYCRLQTPPLLCSGCGAAPVCGPVCERCGDHSAAECAALRACARPLTESTQLVLPLRCLLLRRAGDAAWDALSALEAHVEQRRDAPVWAERQHSVVQALRDHGLLQADEDDELVQRVCGVLDVNSFELRGPPAGAERLRGVYLTAALMAHDCVANTHLAVDDAFQMTVHASVAISKGEPIYFNYTNAMQGTAERREHLRVGKYFHCACARCSDVTELGTHMSSLRCVRCADGLMCAVEDLWRCVDCGHELRANLVGSALRQVRTALQDVDRTDLREMEALLRRLGRTLSPQHSLVLELKQSLVALYRDAILRDRTPSRKLLLRKTELCRQLLPVLAIIEPGISRLRGITTYELHVPLVLLANRLFQAGELEASELLVRLQEAETHLREAVSHLLYEPAHSPEGQLTRAAMQELRNLRENIQDTHVLCANPATLRKGNKPRRK